MRTAQPLTIAVMDELKAMLDDPDMITLDGYTPDGENYPTNRISFIEQHVRYLRAHKNVNPEQYLSNLKLMIKKRG